MASSKDLDRTLELLNQHKWNAAEVGRIMGKSRKTIHDRVKVLRSEGRLHVTDAMVPKGRQYYDISDGTGIVFSDAHFWPCDRSTAYRGLLHLSKKLKPKLVVANGDVTDMATVSRHPPLGWDHLPTVKDELDVASERLEEIRMASKAEDLYWPVGNHDARLECRLAQVAPELVGVYGTSLQDHFPCWTPCYSLFVNEDVVIKHRWKGGIHATHNNTLNSGVTTITGHLHSQKVTPVTDYRGTRWGVDTGCLADIWGQQFAYIEDSPRNWRSGFCVLTWVKGELLTPELVRAVRPGVIEFRGELINV